MACNYIKYLPVAEGHKSNNLSQLLKSIQVLFCVRSSPLPHLLADIRVPSTPCYLCKLCFMAWRLQRKACVCQGGQIRAHQWQCLRSKRWPSGHEVKALSHWSTWDMNEPTAVHCHHLPKRKESKLPFQELWPLCQYNTQPLSLI